MLEDSEVHLIEVLLCCGNSAVISIEKYVHSLACRSPSPHK